MRRLEPIGPDTDSDPPHYFHFSLTQGIPDPYKETDPWNALRYFPMNPESD